MTVTVPSSYDHVVHVGQAWALRRPRLADLECRQAYRLSDLGCKQYNRLTIVSTMYDIPILQ